MEDWLPKLISPVIAALVAAYVGYIHGRWSKHKEIIYQQKFTIYSGLVEKLLEFMMACAPRKNLTLSDYPTFRTTKATISHFGKRVSSEAGVAAVSNASGRE